MRIVLLLCIALPCYCAAAVALGRALGARSLDYPEVKPRRRSNYARTAGGHNDLRKVSE